MLFVFPRVTSPSFFLGSRSIGGKLVGQCSARSRFRMMATTSRRSEDALVTDVLTHWFGSTNVDRFDNLKSQFPLWYGTGKEIDDDIRSRFGEDVEVALQGGWDQLINSDQHPITGELALVILLDQYTRNIFRGTAKAFSGDEKTLKIASSILTPERWQLAKDKCSVPQLMSFMLPLMHQESPQHLDTCIEKTKELIEDSKAVGERAAAVSKFAEENLSYAYRHRDIIEQYGRYPYRNTALGRTSTPEELKFLEDGPRFGQ